MIGDPIDTSERKDNNNVFVPSSPPIISNIDIRSLLAHFDTYVYDVSDTSHIRHVVEVLCGQPGLGQLLYQSVRDWLNGGVETAWLGFVDHLFEQIYGLPRIYQEKNNFNPSDAILTTEEEDKVLVKEAWYKSRFVELMRGLTSGGTLQGFHYIVNSLTYDDCDIYETWNDDHSINSPISAAAEMAFNNGATSLCILPVFEAPLDDTGKPLDKNPHQSLTDALEKLKLQDDIAIICPIGFDKDSLVQIRNHIDWCNKNRLERRGIFALDGMAKAYSIEDIINVQMSLDNSAVMLVRTSKRFSERCPADC